MTYIYNDQPSINIIIYKSIPNMVLHGVKDLEDLWLWPDLDWSG